VHSTKPAGRITLHGAVDVQGWLQRATVQEIQREVNRLMEQVGAGGGFIISPSHHLQPDIPLENVLAFYRTVARRRGKRLSAYPKTFSPRPACGERGRG
jgi:uroporphyrinogen-III decarboxylase